MSASLIRVQTELPFNLNPHFTKWLAKSGALHEAFVLIDVGVLGGENPRWHFLGDHLIVHGFDPSKEAVDDLSRSKVLVFQDGNDHPLVVLTEDLIASDLTLMDQDVLISVADASRPLVFEIRAGLARSGGILSLNHVPPPALASAVQFRWLPIEKATALLDPT